MVALQLELKETKKTVRSIKDRVRSTEGSDVCLMTEKKKTYAESVGINSRVATLATQKKNPHNIVKIVPESKEICGGSKVTK